MVVQRSYIPLLVRALYGLLITYLIFFCLGGVEGGFEVCLGIHGHGYINEMGGGDWGGGLGRGKRD